MRKEIEAQYTAEQKQNEIDHHVPTAGAMTNHILSNLRILSTKLNQFTWYIKGSNYFADQNFLQQMRDNIDQKFMQLGTQLVQVGEKPSSTTAEFSEYGMIQEDPRAKYFTADEMFAELVKDIQTSKLFISRAIILAKNEEKYPLQQFLIALDGQLNANNQAIQARLGNDPLTGLDDEDDE